MDRVAVCVESHRAILVPLEQQCPKVGVIAPQEPQLVNALIVAEPAAGAAGVFINWGKQSFILAPQTAQVLIPASLYQWQKVTGFVYVPSDTLWLISRNAQKMDDIFLRPSPPGALGKLLS